uniref:Uncharacterized protein n=1 Tax=Anguilla anguilla TaxID=7936 RepID=A0A0E9WMK1_ANGAN
MLRTMVNLGKPQSPYYFCGQKPRSFFFHPPTTTQDFLIFNHFFPMSAVNLCSSPNHDLVLMPLLVWCLGMCVHRTSTNYFLNDHLGFCESVFVSVLVFDLPYCCALY